MKFLFSLLGTLAQKNILAFLFFFISCFSAPHAAAATYYWDTNDSTPGFGTAGGTWAAPTTNNSTQGWSTSSAGTLTLSGETTTTTSDALNFGTTSAGLAAGTITVSGNVSSAGITFGNASGNITLTGGSITLNGLLYRLGSAATTQTINSDIVLVGARQFGANQVNEKLVFGGNISGSGASLTVDTNANGGFITLNGTNSFTGNLSIVRSQLNINSVSDKLVNSALGAGSKIIAGAAGGQGPILNYTANSSGSTNRDFELNVMGGGSLSIISQNAALNLSGTAYNTVANGYGILKLSGDGGGGANINEFSGSIQDNGTSTMGVELLNITPVSGSGENGFWKFSGNNTYSGTVTVTNASTLIVGHSNALGTTANGTTVAANGQLLLADGVSVGAEALVLNSTAGSNWNGQTLAALRSYTGNNSWAGNITISQATTIATNSGSNLTISGGITGTNQNLTINSIGDTILAGNITTGTGTLTKNGSGNLTLSGANTFTGATTINAGTLQIGAGGTIGSLSASSTITNNGTLVFNRSDALVQGTQFSSAAIGGTGSVIKNGAGNLTLNAANTYTGATTISAGTLTVSGGSAIADTSAVSVGGGTVLNLGASETIGSIAGSGNITLGSFTLTAGGDNSSTSVSGQITGTGGLTKTGSGTLTLAGNNTYSGNTTISAGTIKAGSTTALASTGAFSIAAGATLDLGGFSNTISSLTTATGTITDSSSIGNGGTLRIANAMPSGTSAQLFTGSMGLQLYGGSTVSGILTNTASTYSGGTTFGNGSGTTSTRLLVSGTIGSGSGGAVTNGIYGTGAITLGAATTDRVQFYFAGATTINNNIVVNSSSGNAPTEVGAFRAESAGNVIASSINANLADAMFNAINASGRTISVTGQILGNSGVIVTTANSGGINVTLNNAGIANSYAGNTTINTANSTLTLGRADQISNGTGKGNLIINSGTFKMGGFNEMINGLSGNGTIDGVSGTPTLTIGDNNATSTFSGTIKNTSGTLGLTKIGTGTLVLSGNNTYSGATVINSGTLEAAHAGALGSNNTVQVTGGSLLVTADDAINGKNIELSTNTIGLKFSGNYSGAMGSLTLSADSIIDLGSGSVRLLLQGITFSTHTLSFYNWTGLTLSEGGTGADQDRVYFGPDLSDEALAKISFYSGSANDSFLGTGFDLGLRATGFDPAWGYQIIPVPESETWATGLLLLLGGAWWMWRNRKSESLNLVATALRCREGARGNKLG